MILILHPASVFIGPPPFFLKEPSQTIEKRTEKATGNTITTACNAFLTTPIGATKTTTSFEAFFKVIFIFS